ncbi:hypothetical protein HQ524_00305 [Candidatus Uhrbacteria bacterium]|nr:hypothetical protein [Candidatus Uhrbacteria bacterium]
MTLTQQIRTGIAVIGLLAMGAASLLAVPANAGFTAGDPTAALTQSATQTSLGGGPNDQIFITIGNIVNVGLGLLGIIFFVLMVYAGFLWMTARGNPDQVTKAQTMITQAVIGIIVILSAFAVSSFVLSQLITATNTTA